MFEQPQEQTAQPERSIHPAFDRFYRMEDGQRALDSLINDIGALPEFLNEVPQEGIEVVRKAVENYQSGNKDEARVAMRRVLN